MNQRNCDGRERHREALQRLTAEGLALAENRHRFVADFSFHEVEVIFDLRSTREPRVVFAMRSTAGDARFANAQAALEGARAYQAANQAPGEGAVGES